MMCLTWVEGPPSPRPNQTLFRRPLPRPGGKGNAAKRYARGLCAATAEGAAGEKQQRLFAAVVDAQSLMQNAFQHLDGSLCKEVVDSLAVPFRQEHWRPCPGLGSFQHIGVLRCQHGWKCEQKLQEAKTMGQCWFLEKETGKFLVFKRSEGKTHLHLGQCLWSRGPLLFCSCDKILVHFLVHLKVVCKVRWKK